MTSTLVSVQQLQAGFTCRQSQGLNCAGTVRYCLPALLEKARDRTGTSTARGSAFPRSRAEKFYCHGSKRKSRTNKCRHCQLDIDQVRLCVLHKCTAISADSITVVFVKHVLCGHFIVPLIILIWYIMFPCDKNVIPNEN